MAGPPEQLPLPLASAPAAAPPSRAPAQVAPPATGPRRPRVAQLGLHLRQPPAVAVLAGGGAGSGHRRGRLVALPGGGVPARPLPTRDEITSELLGALADVVAGRISTAAASAIREAAEEALAQLEASERDPHRAPNFVRAARALQELLPRR